MVKPNLTKRRRMPPYMGLIGNASYHRFAQLAAQDTQLEVVAWRLDAGGAARPVSQWRWDY